jgi:hypothetical protein
VSKAAPRSTAPVISAAAAKPAIAAPVSTTAGAPAPAVPRSEVRPVLLETREQLLRLQSHALAAFHAEAKRELEAAREMEEAQRRLHCTRMAVLRARQLLEASRAETTALLAPLKGKALYYPEPFTAVVPSHSQAAIVALESAARLQSLEAQLASERQQLALSSRAPLV